MHNDNENIIDKAKNYLFPAKKVLDKAGTMGGDMKKTPAPSTDTSYIHGIVNQRMKEKMAAPKNPLADAIKKSTPKTTPMPKMPVKKK